MVPVDDHPDVTRSIVALVAVVFAAIALLVGFGATIAWLIPDGDGGTRISEPESRAPSFADANAASTKLGCTEPQPFDARRGVAPDSDAPQPESTASCVNDGGILYVLVFADKDARRSAEKHGDPKANVCSFTPQASDVETKLGLVRGPNWLVLAPAGLSTAETVGERAGRGVVVGEVDCPTTS